MLKTTTQSILSFFIIFQFSDLSAQIPEGRLHGQVSRVSGFEFALYNSGLLYGDYFQYPAPYTNVGGFAASRAYWPRRSNFMGSCAWTRTKGIIFLAKKNGEFFYREATSENVYSTTPNLTHGPFWGMVPGRIGDPKAGYDERYGGVGWRYVDDRD
jgi:hypothetical protein